MFRPSFRSNWAGKSLSFLALGTGREPLDSTEVGRTLDQYVVEIGLALLVLMTATAAWIVSRQRYVKSADFKRGIEAVFERMYIVGVKGKTAGAGVAAVFGEHVLDRFHESDYVRLAG